jgi:hypothetical protein
VAQNRARILRNVGENRDTHSELGLLVPGTSSGVSDMDDPNVGIFDTVMNAVWVSCDKTATQLWNFCVAKPEMRSRGDEFGSIQECPTYPVGRSRILFGYVFKNVPEIVASARCKPERHRPPGLSSAAISSADTASPRLA